MKEDVPIIISPQIIPNIASMYTDVNRVFMEYIDNSLDNADDKYYDQKSNSYNKKILITLTVNNDNSIEFTDNCAGITNFKKIVSEIGNSDKKAQPWTNGQFGFGIYSFMAFCNNLQIHSQLQDDDKSNYIDISASIFSSEKKSNFYIPVERRSKINQSGTKIILTNFKNKRMKFDINEINDEIRSHFEEFLYCKNLEIVLTDKKTGKRIVCEPRTYNTESIKEYNQTIPSVMVDGKSIKFKEPVTVKIYISTNQTSFDKPPFFVIKKRRIVNICDTENFDSQEKQRLWKHPHITGSVDLKTNIEPVIHRKGFKKSAFLKAIFQVLKDIEVPINNIIKDINKDREDRGYSKVEDRLNEAMAKLSRKVNLMNRRQFLPGSDVKAEIDGPGISSNIRGSNHRTGELKDDPTPVQNPGGSDIGSGSGDSTKGGDNTNNNDGLKEPENPFDDDLDTASEKRRPGLDIKISSGYPDKGEDGTLHKSRYLDGTITIWKEHEEFQKRLKKTRQDEPKITARLIFYLSTQITTHYLDAYYMKKGQPEYSKKLFLQLTDVQLEFEELIKDLDGKSLSDFE